MRRLRVAASAALAIAGGVGLLLDGSAATAQGAAVFRGTASAEGARVGVVAVGAPVTNHLVDVAAPIAQAALDSTTGSSAMASVAYPGDLVVTAPGLVAGLTGGETSGLIPEYPLIAVAGSTTAPEARADAPGTAMRAHGTDRSAGATASTGSDGIGPAPTLTLTTTAEVTEAEDGTVTATATSTTSAVTIGPLAIGSITSTSTVTRAPGEEPTREASFEVAGVKLAGVDLAFTDTGLVIAGTTLPVSTSTLVEVLQASGLEVELVDEEETVDGVVSAGLLVRRRLDLPATVSPVTATFSFGRAIAEVSPVSLPGLRARPAPAAPGPLVEAPAPPPPAVAPVGAPPSSPPTSAPPVPVEDVQPARHAAPLFDLRPIYLAMAAAGGTAGVAIELLRHLGVRLRWT